MEVCSLRVEPRRRRPRIFCGGITPRRALLLDRKAHGSRLTRCHIKSPSFQNWPAMPFAVAGNIIADFPLINKSFNLSYSGCDR